MSHNQIINSHNQLTVYQYYIKKSSTSPYRCLTTVMITNKKNFTLRADVFSHRLLGLIILTVDHQDCHCSVCCKSFVSENLCEKLLPILSSVTFRIFWGHRCILNLPYVLRIGVVHFRSPSHQPSTSHHCV